MRETLLVSEKNLSQGGRVVCSPTLYFAVSSLRLQVEVFNNHKEYVEKHECKGAALGKNACV